VVSVARWRKAADGEIPADVMAAWIAGDPDGLANDWLDDLYGQDPDRWAEVFIALISIPSYTAP
jgi:hypothetical protein